MPHTSADDDAAKAVGRANTEMVQGGGDFALFDTLFADDFVDHTPQPALLPTRQVCAFCTPGCVRRSRPSLPRFIGKPFKTASSRLSRPTTARTEVNSSALHRRADVSSSRRWTRCGYATARSPTTGEWPTSTRCCNSSDSFRLRHSGFSYWHPVSRHAYS
jgi:hypothetical protein